MKQEQQLEAENTVFVPHKLRRFYTPLKERAQPKHKEDFRAIELPDRQKTTHRKRLKRFTVSQIINTVMNGRKTYKEVAL